MFFLNWRPVLIFQLKSVNFNYIDVFIQNLNFMQCLHVGIVFNKPAVNNLLALITCQEIFILLNKLNRDVNISNRMLKSQYLVIIFQRVDTV